MCPYTISVAHMKDQDKRACHCHRFVMFFFFFKPLSTGIKQSTRRKILILLILLLESWSIGITSIGVHVVDK